VRWKDDEGKPHNTPYPRWWWTLNVGEVPDGYGVSYKDGNPENLDSDNFYLVSLREISRKNVPENLVTVCKSCHKAIHGWVNKTNDKIKYYQPLLPEEV